MPVFPDSTGLKVILESHGWTLYRLISLSDRFEDLEIRGPATEYQVGSTYWLLPVKGRDQTLLKATMQAARPELFYRGISHKLSRFTNFEFLEGVLRVRQTRTDFMDVPYGEVIATFQNNFRGALVAKPQEPASPK